MSETGPGIRELSEMSTTPSRGAQRLIRIGMIKARDTDLGWLRASLQEHPTRAERVRWVRPNVLVTSGVLAIGGGTVAIAVDNTDVWLGQLIGVALSGGLLAALAPGWFYRRIRKLALRRHGLDTDGRPMFKNGFIARMSPESYRRFNVASGIVAVVVLLGLALVLRNDEGDRTGLRGVMLDAEVTECFVGDREAVAAGEVRARAGGADPVVSWVDEQGRTVASAPVETTGDFRVSVPVVESFVPVNCTIG